MTIPFEEVAAEAPVPEVRVVLAVRLVQDRPGPATINLLPSRWSLKVTIWPQEEKARRARRIAVGDMARAQKLPASKQPRSSEPGECGLATLKIAVHDWPLREAKRFGPVRPGI